MVTSEPTGAMTVAPGQGSSTPADVISTDVNKAMFGDIKNKFLNEMTKIPREWDAFLFVFNGICNDLKNIYNVMFLFPHGELITPLDPNTRMGGYN